MDPTDSKASHGPVHLKSSGLTYTQAHLQESQYQVLLIQRQTLIKTLEYSHLHPNSQHAVLLEKSTQMNLFKIWNQKISCIGQHQM